MIDRRQQIVEAGIETLREHGYAGFTQPKVAARAGLRQSHLTYYHPTRLDLLAAVGRVAVDRQLAAVDATLGGLASPEAAASAIAELITRTGNTTTRVLMIQDPGGSIPTPFLVVLTFWLAALFGSFGLFARANATVTVALLVGAVSVAGAVFLILELDRPLDGFMRLSVEPLRQAVLMVGQ